MSERPVQYFSDEYLKNCQKMTPTQIAKFLDDFRILFGRPPEKSKLISIKIPENLLSIFRRRAELEGIPYQTKIKELMKEWLLH
jgi:predicted DNA binding CopG/RHH family protein